MEDSFSDMPRRSTRRVLLQSRKDFERQSPIHSDECVSVSRKRKHSSGGGEEERDGEGDSSLEGEWRRNRGGSQEKSHFTKRSTSALYATRHKQPRVRSNSSAVAMDTMEPLRRSKREKRLLFSNLNTRRIYQHLSNRHYSVLDDFSEEELDPYEKILSPVRRRRPRRQSPHPSTRPPLSPTHNQQAATGDGDDGGMTLRSSKLQHSIKAESIEGVHRRDEGGEREVEEEGGGGGEEMEQNKDGEKEGDSEDEGSEEEEEEEEERERGYYLRKRRPVVYQYQPIVQVVEEDTPPKKRRQRGHTSASDSTYYRKLEPSRASRAYQSKGRSTAVVSRRIRRVAHAHDSSSTSTSGSDSDEARFRRRKSRSMKKVRRQCLPMNFDPEELSQPIVRDRQRIGASLADVDPMAISRQVTFDSIGGLKQHISSLKEMILFPLLYPEVFDRFKIQPPRGVLFYGPPGCGKTLVARALANECSKGGKKVAFFMRKGADCLSKWVGESERQLRLLFDQAYQLRPSIIFFDEIDGLAPVRSTRQDQIHSSIVSTLLALMDGLDSRGEIVVIGATNRIDAIDPALRRPGRFDREFLFPLPSREDRSSIISIHTNEWSPPLKQTFITQLADQTVGYCGADLKSLCTEAALSALRRTYPQIYETGDKLVLDVTTINIVATDFYVSLKNIVPTAQRSDCSVACALREEVWSLMIGSFRTLLNLVSVIFNPAWKAVEKAQNSLQVAMAMERQRESEIEECVARMREKSGETNSVSDQVFRIHHTSCSGFHANRASSNRSLSSRSNSQGRENSQNSVSEVFSSSQPVSLSNVYFNMKDIVNEVGGVESITVDTTNSEDPQNEASEISNGVSIFHPSGAHSHPHSLPNVHRPRLLLCGAAGQGQSSHLGPALLHALEEFPVKILDLSVIFGVSSRSPEETLTQLFREAKRVAPSIFYLPRIDTWWDVTTETFQATLTSSLISLPPSTSLIVVATAECTWQELSPSLRHLFSAASEMFSPPPPSREARARFFSRVFLVRPLQPPLPTPQSDGVVQHEQLQIAPPPKPRELAPDELRKMDRQRSSVLRELRMFLRDATNKLLAERKFKEFIRPVDCEEVPDYYDIIRQPMDLGTVMKKIDEHQYTTPKQWLEDVDQTTKNALEYNPEHDSESRLLRHRAVALQDMAHSILEHELSEDFEQQCEDIEDTYKKIGRKPPHTSPIKPSPSTSTYHIPHRSTPSPSRSSTQSSRQGSFYEARRRSLRQKGLQPEEKGFDYYAPSRTPRKEREGWEEEEEGGEGEGEEGTTEETWEDESSRREEEGEYFESDVVGEGIENGGLGKREGSVENDEHDGSATHNSSTLVCNSDVGRSLRQVKTNVGDFKRQHSEDPLCSTNTTTSNGFTETQPGGSAFDMSSTAADESTASEDWRNKSNVKQRLFQKGRSSLLLPTQNNLASETVTSNSPTMGSQNRKKTDNHVPESQTRVRISSNGSEVAAAGGNGWRKSSWGSESRKGKNIVGSGDVTSEKLRKSKCVSASLETGLAENCESSQQLCNGPSHSSDLWLGASTKHANVQRDDDDEAMSTEVTHSTEQISNFKSTQNSSSALNGTTSRFTVDVDHCRLLSVFQRVVDRTEDCSVEVMEKMLSTFEHLVFRYRMRSDRRQLVTDLELAANLFLHQN